MRVRHLIIEHHEGEPCPSCKSDDRRKLEWIGKLRKRKGKFGEFFGCTRYPDCKYTWTIKWNK